jgi:serine/threonine protein kinase
MTVLSDAAVTRLRGAIDQPDAGDRYPVHELIGRGGMGAVYRAHDTVLERDVALKVISTGADAPAVAERIRREARVLASMEHPGIVAVHDAGELDDGRPFYVMRLVHGATLDEHAARASRGELLRVFLRICDAVAYAHARDVIHRDLKPANVMIGEFGDVLVLDWGVARFARTQPAPGNTPPVNGNTGDAVVIGTPGFMAPEQAAGASATADARADLYSLGVILGFLLEQSNEPVPNPLKAIVARATRIAAEERYQSVDRLAEDVRHWLDGEAVSAYTESLFEKAARFYRRNRALILLIAAYAVVRLVILLWRGV